MLWTSVRGTRKDKTALICDAVSISMGMILRGHLRYEDTWFHSG